MQIPILWDPRKMIRVNEQASPSRSGAPLTRQPVRYRLTNKANSYAEAPQPRQPVIPSPPNTKGRTVMTALTGDSQDSRKFQNTPRRGLSSWFSTSSSNSGGYDLHSTPRTFTMSTNSPQASLSDSTTPQTLNITSKATDEPEDLSSLNINDALFPPSCFPSNQDPYSPTAFNDLLTNAEKLLTRLQSAYVQRTHTLREISSSRDALAIELDQANTRAESLRSQLEVMAHRGTIQDQRIVELERELQESKSCQYTAAILSENNSLVYSPSTLENQANNILSTVNDDSGQDSNTGRISWRSSISSAQLSAEVDTAGESDAESGTTDSLFSRSRSPAPTTTSVATSIMSDDTPPTLQRFLPFSVGSKFGARMRPALPSQKSSSNSRSPKDSFPFETGCPNCRGKNNNLAWDTVELLRAENMGLKEQIVTLQDGVDGALAAIMSCS